ncbi:hypothetical protein BC833DRAFT_618874 [Globomyces pollinis-pini]|nr:hypothetical protein BC833DRAFT_618874 [Globomyces pollinis-pini]
MMKFLVGVVVGIYIAQEYKDKVPNLKNKVTEVFSILKAAEKEIKSESKADKKEE